MTGRLARRIPSFGQIALFLMGLALIYLLVDFGQQIDVLKQRRAELDRLGQRITGAEAEQEKLIESKSLAESDQATEQWAREKGWAKSDEIPVVVVAPVARPSLTETREPEEQAGPSTYREAWWELFFGKR